MTTILLLFIRQNNTYYIMGSIVRNYVWCLNNFNLCPGHSSTNSPTFIIEDCQCKFFLQFDFNEGVNEISVFLCRCDDTGPTAVKVNFLLSLKSFSDRCVHKFRNTFTFSKGQINGFTVRKTQQELFECLYNEYNSDVLIITCETINRKPKFMHYGEDIRVLSEDLLKLYVEGDCANAYLITEGCSIPVHKEILSARSAVFQQKFITCCRLETPFPLAVVKAMLTFLYSANISKIDFGSLSVQKLLYCAMYYNISDLVSLLTPRMTYFTTMVDHKNENHTMQFKNFTTLCKSLHYVEHPPIKMKFDKNIDMRTKVLLEPYVKSGMIILEVTLSNLFDVKGVFVRLFLLDNFNNRYFSRQVYLEPTIEGKVKFCFEYQSEKLFSETHLILPNDVLSLQYEFKFRLSDKFSISDPDVPRDDEYELLCGGVGRSLVKSMDYLLQSKCFSDLKLLLPCEGKSVQVSVHKSILSARSSVFRDIMKTGQEISIDLPAKVVNDLLNYIYTGILNASGLRSLSLLHEAAGTYQVNQLKRSCKAIVANVAPYFNNVYAIYLIAIRSGDYELQKSCKDFILKNKDIVLGSKRWDNFRKKYAKASDEIMTYIETKS